MIQAKDKMIEVVCGGGGNVGVVVDDVVASIL